MRPFCSVTADLQHNLIRVTLSGFFDDAALTRFVETRRAAHAQLRCPANQHSTLADVRGIAIQSQAMVARWRQVLADPRYQGRRLAFVAVPTLARHQLHRAIGARDARVFTDVDEAEAWVLSDARERRAA